MTPIEFWWKGSSRRILIDSGVRVKTWYSVTKEKPTQFFHIIEQPPTKKSLLNKDTLDPLPPWNHIEMAFEVKRMLLLNPEDPFRILAWFTYQDEKYNRKDSMLKKYDFQGALLWFTLVDSLHKKHWYLMYVYRSYPSPDSITCWTMDAMATSYIYCEYCKLKGLKHFEFSPKNSEIYEFTHSCGSYINSIFKWRRKIKKDHEVTSVNGEYWHQRLLDSAVRVNTWREVVGEEPTQFFQVKD